MKKQSPGQTPRVGILTNPHSRGNRNAASRARREGEHISASLEDVPRALDRVLEDGATVLAINGGDGTLGAAIAHLEQRGKMLPLIPVLGGTNNAVAKDVRAIGSLAAVMARVRTRADALPAARTRARNTVRVCRVDGQGKAHMLGVGFVFSTGLIARFTDAYYEGPWVGPPQAARVLAIQLAKLLRPNAETRAFWAFEPNTIHIDAHALSLPDGAQLVVASTLDTQILFFKPFAARATNIAGFNVLVNALPARAIARHLLPLARGSYRGHGHWTSPALELSVSGTRKAYLDGEPIDCTPSETLRISAGPRVHFLQL